MANAIEVAIKLFKKHKEIIFYLIFGVLTTIVNYIIYGIFIYIFGISAGAGDKNLVLAANAIAWVGAVIFAFVTNKLIVFESKARDAQVVAKEALLFAGGRLVTLAIETGVILLGLRLFIWLQFSEDRFNLYNWAVKVVASVIVIVLNYIISKLFIFKGEDKADGQKEQNTFTDSTGL